MGRLAGISGKDTVKALGKIGYYIDEQEGSHMILICQSPRPYASKRVSVPNHKELDKGTLRSIIRKTGLTVDEFESLL